MSLNGEVVVRDRLVTGQLLQEFSRKVSLDRGQWNELRVKAMQLSWAGVSLCLSVCLCASLSHTPALYE